MRFEIYGGFKVVLEDHGVVPRQAKKQKSLWEETEERESGLTEACGCYVFAIKSGGGYTPWYIGKAEKSSFKQECFGHFQINCYNDALARYKKGTPLLYLVAMSTPSGRLARPSKSGNRAIAFLERWLIGEALSKNQDLCNIKDTKFLKKLVVPGLMGNGPGHPTRPQQEFRLMMRNY